MTSSHTIEAITNAAAAIAVVALVAVIAAGAIMAWVIYEKNDKPGQ